VNQALSGLANAIP